MFYVVSDYRILAESETPMQMKDYPGCLLLEGSPGVSMIDFEIYEEDGIRRVRSKPRKDNADVEIKVPLKQKDKDSYVMEACNDKVVEMEVKLIGELYLPPLIQMPEKYDKNKIEITCNRGKLDKTCMVGSGIIKWTPVNETVDCVLIFTVINFPPIQKVVKIQLI